MTLCGVFESLKGQLPVADRLFHEKLGKDSIPTFIHHQEVSRSFRFVTIHHCQFAVCKPLLSSVSMMKSPNSPSDDSSSFTDDQSVTKSTSFSQISGSASSSTSSLKAAIYRLPTPSSSRSSPFTFEGGKAVRFLKKSSKDFDTFLDACNYAADNGFVINHEVDDWFALIENAGKECSKKKLLATLTKPTGNDVSCNIGRILFLFPVSYIYIRSLFPVLSNDSHFPNSNLSCSWRIRKVSIPL